LEVAHVQTFGEIILLKIPLEASVPDLLGKLKASDGKLKEMTGKYKSVVERALKERTEAATTVSNAKKTISENIVRYHHTLGSWQKQFKEKTKLEREGHLAEMKRVLDEVVSLKGARDQDSERCDAVETELASTRTQVEEANHRNNILESENRTARERFMRQAEEANCHNENLKENISELEENISELERVEADATALRSSHAATIAQLEEANCRNEELEENISELERVEADATVLRSSHAATIARLEEANRRNEKNEEMLEEIAKENEELELLADLRSNHVRTLSFERNQAKSELKELRLERSTINAEVFDIASLIPSPTDFGDLSFRRSFNELMFDDVPPLVMTRLSRMIHQIDPCRRISRLIKGFINKSYRELLRLGIVCPPNNEETIEQILGRSVVETARYLLHFIDQIMSVDVWNEICFLFDINHITPRIGAFSINRSSDFWVEMTINHHSNLQLLPSKFNRSKGKTLIAVMERAFDSDGKFLRWEHVSHNVKQIHDTAEYMKNECHLLFNQWKTKGVESTIYDEANKQTGGHFENLNHGNMDDDVSVGSETHQPDLETHQADGTQVDASDGISCLTDPTSPNLAFTLPQMATRINPFPCQLPHQAAGNVEEANRPNESLQSENSEEDEDDDFSIESENSEEDEDVDFSLESENSEEDEEEDFSLESENSEEGEEEDFSLEADDDPFINPEIDGHVWQVNERSKKFPSCSLISFLIVSYSQSISEARRLSP
jgi:hypothetical protein